MAASKELRPPVPHLDPAKLRSAALLQTVDEWVHRYYVPVEAADELSVDENPNHSSLSTMEVLEQAFGDMLDAGNLAALGQSIDKQSLNWVRRTDLRRHASKARRVPRSSVSVGDDDPTGGHDPLEIVLTAREKMLSVLNELEDALSRISPVPSAIGGNHPPVEIGLPPYSEQDDSAVRFALRTLRAASPAPKVPSASAEDAVEVLEDTGRKVTNYIASLGDLAVKKFAEEFGKAGAIGVVGLGIWTVIGEKLLSAAQAASHWIEAIKLFM